MQHGITQCYLPPGRGDVSALIPAEAGTRLSDPEGCKAELTYTRLTYLLARHPCNGVPIVPKRDQVWGRIVRTLHAAAGSAGAARVELAVSHV